MLYRIRKSGKFGYVDIHGQEVVPCKYTYAVTFAEGLGCLLAEDRTALIVDRTGSIQGKIKNVEDLGLQYSGGYLSFKRDEKVGFIDQHGNVVVQPMFNSVGLATNGMVIAALDKLSGVYSFANEWLLQPTRYLLIHGFSNGCNVTTACTGLDEPYVIIDSQGSLQSDRKFKQALGCKDGLIPVLYFEDSEDYGWVDEKGRTVVLGKFHDVGGEFHDGMIACEIGGKWGIAARDGSIVLEPQFALIRDCCSGMRAYAIRRRGTDGEEVKSWGFLTNRGEIAIEARFDGVNDFYGDAAIAYFRADRTKNFVRKYVVINCKGDIIARWT